MPVPVVELSAVTVVEAAATSLRRVIGFGTNLIAVPLLLSINPRFVPGPLLVVGWLTSIVMGKLEWRHVDRRSVAVMLAASVPGSVLGVVVLKVLTVGQYSILTGVLVLGAVAVSLDRAAVSVQAPFLMVAGCASGFMSSSAAIGGPPVALALQRMEPATIRSSIAVFSAVSTPISVAVLSAFGRFNLASGGLALELLPGVLIGLGAGSLLAPRVRPASIRHLVLLLCVVSAGFAIQRGVH